MGGNLIGCGQADTDTHDEDGQQCDEHPAGALKAVLEGYATEHPPFYLYYPEHNRRLKLLRLLIDFLASKRPS